MKTIRLSNNYVLKGNQVFRFDYQVSSDNYETIIKEIPTNYKIGNKAVLVSNTDYNNFKNTKSFYYLHFDLEGVAGNSNPNIKKTEGWRGSYNNVNTDAYGVVEIVKFKHYTNGDIGVVVK
jgi:hypothetical protein